MKANSGTTQHYFEQHDAHILSKISIANGPTVQLPSNGTMSSTLAGMLPISDNLSATVCTAYVFDKLHSMSLISLSQLCDDGCMVHLDKNNLQVCKQQQLVLNGTQIMTDGL